MSTEQHSLFVRVEPHPPILVVSTYKSRALSYYVFFRQKHRQLYKRKAGKVILTAMIAVTVLLLHQALLESRAFLPFGSYQDTRAVLAANCLKLGKNNTPEFDVYQYDSCLHRYVPI